MDGNSDSPFKRDCDFLLACIVKNHNKCCGQNTVFDAMLKVQIDAFYSKQRDSLGSVCTAEYEIEIERLKQENADLRNKINVIQKKINLSDEMQKRSIELNEANNQLAIELFEYKKREDKTVKLMEINTELQRQINNLGECKSENTKLRNKIDGFFTENHTLKDQIQKLKEERDFLEREKMKIENAHESFSSDLPVSNEISVPTGMTSHNDAIARFNTWATKSNHPLPQQFYFLEGDPKKRYDTVHLANESDSPTRWIVNRVGHGQHRQYLLPNPDFFDEGTDISRLYLMQDTKNLGGRGENKIEIIKACEIQNGEIISCGELKIL